MRHTIEVVFDSFDSDVFNWVFYEVVKTQGYLTINGDIHAQALEVTEDEESAYLVYLPYEPGTLRATGEISRIAIENIRRIEL